MLPFFGEMDEVNIYTLDPDQSCYLFLANAMDFG